MRETHTMFNKKGYNEEYDIYCSQYLAKKSEKSTYVKELEFNQYGELIEKTYKWEIYQINVNQEKYWKKIKKMIQIRKTEKG